MALNQIETSKDLEKTAGRDLNGNLLTTLTTVVDNAKLVGQDILAQNKENSGVVDMTVALGSFVFGSGSTGQKQGSKSIFKWKCEARSKRAG